MATTPGLLSGPREYVLAFWLLVVLVVFASSGIRWQSGAILLGLAGVTVLAQLRLARTRVGLMRGLGWAAASGMKGTAIISWVFVLPKVLIANTCACVLGVLSLVLPASWIETAWLQTVRLLGPRRPPAPLKDAATPPETAST